jgi:prepilin-type N-terminal cleavage/methylation domain-containing protein
MVPSRAGFTLVEVLVAVVILAIGSLMLAAGALFTTRELVRTRGQTAAGAVAQAKVDELRTLAASTTPPCTSVSFASSGSSTVAGGITMSWVVSPSGGQRTIRVITNYKLGRGKTRTDTLTTLVGC